MIIDEASPDNMNVVHPCAAGLDVHKLVDRAPFDPGAIARFGLSDARTAWKACGQSLWALLAGVLIGVGIDHIQ